MYKKFIKLFFICIFIFPSIFFILAYYRDPIQVFHKSYIGCENYFDDNMRLQAAGVINNFDFDSIIFGSSMLENTSAKEASKNLVISLIFLCLVVIFMKEVLLWIMF